jgi:hypoxanthine phosphoribosyltransferase
MSRIKYSIIENYTWEQLQSDIEILAEKIRTEFNPDIVICISTGGWIPGRLLKNFFNASFFSIGCLAYNEEGNYTGAIKITQSLGSEIDLSGKNVLLIDEVCETGGTLNQVSDYVKTLNPLKVRTGVLHLKEHAIFKADFYVYEVRDKWIKYPWSKV